MFFLSLVTCVLIQCSLAFIYIILAVLNLNLCFYSLISVHIFAVACVLSPLLYIYYTNTYFSNWPHLCIFLQRLL